MPKRIYALGLALLGGFIVHSQTVTYVTHSAAFSLPHNPYLQIGRAGTGTTMELVWQTDPGKADYEVQWRQMGNPWLDAAILPSYLINVPGDPQQEVHRALLRPDPGIGFEYRVLLDKNPIFVSTGHGRPAEGTTESFAIFGDAGANAEPQARVAYQAYLLKPEYILMTGGLAYDHGTEADYGTHFFPYFTNTFPDRDKGSPLMSSSVTVAIPGEHDLTGDTDTYKDAWGYFLNWVQPLNGPFTEMGQKGAPSLTGKGVDAITQSTRDRAPRMANFSFDMGDAHWVVLDSRKAVDATDPALRQWLDQDLKASTKKWKFVTFHESPFQSSEKNQDDKQMRPLQELFEADGVDIVWCGHVNNYQVSQPIQTGAKKGAATADLLKNDWPFDAAWDGIENTKAHGVIYVVEGGGGAALDEPEKEGHKELWQPFTRNYLSQYSFGFVTVDDDTVRVTQRDMHGSIIDDWKLTK